MSRRLLVIMAIVALVLIGGAVAVVETGGGASRSGSAGGTAPPAARPFAAGLPAGAWQLPAGQSTQETISVGFPHTALGAVAMAYNTVTASASVDPGVLMAVDQTTQLNPTDVANEAQANATAGRMKFGLPASGPTAATLSFSVSGCRVISADPARVVTALEGQYVEDDATHGQQTLSIVAPGVLVWVGSDWKLDQEASTAIAIPQAGAPGPTGASSDGWHTCTIGGK